MQVAPIPLWAKPSIPCARGAWLGGCDDLPDSTWPKRFAAATSSRTAAEAALVRVAHNPKQKSE